MSGQSKPAARLAVLLVSLFCVLAGCDGSKDGIRLYWHDLTEDGYSGNISFWFDKGEEGNPCGIGELLPFDDEDADGFIKVTAVANRTKTLETGGRYRLRDFECDDPDVDLQFCRSNEFPDKLEIFILDPPLSVRSGDWFDIPSAKDAAAYFVCFYDAKLGGDVCVVSDKSKFEIPVVIFRESMQPGHIRSAADILSYIRKNGEYAWVCEGDDYRSHGRNGYNGYVVKSKIDGSLQWVSTSPRYANADEIRKYLDDLKGREGE